MDLLQSQLKLLGLSVEEIQIYLCALEKQATTVLEFAQNTGIPRTTVYLLVDSLLEKGVLQETIEGKKKRYIPISPEELITIAKKREEQYKTTAKLLEQNIPQIQALFNRNAGKPKISVKEGKKGIKEIFKDSLQSDSILMHFTSPTGKELLSDIGEQYYESYLEKMIPTKQIIAATAKNIRHQKTESTARNEIVLIDPRYVAEVDYMIYGNSVVYITYKDNNPHLIMIEDPLISYFEKVRYNLLFEYLKQQDHTNTQ